MPRTLARATPRQRADLERLDADLAEALASLPGRFWARHDERAAYATVREHLRRWMEWER